MTPQQVDLSQQLIRSDWWDLNPSTMPWEPYRPHCSPTLRVHETGILWTWVEEAKSWLPDLDDSGTCGTLFIRLLLKFPKEEVVYQHLTGKGYLVVGNKKGRTYETLGEALASSLLGLDQEVNKAYRRIRGITKIDRLLRGLPAGDIQRIVDSCEGQARLARIKEKRA